EDEVEFTGTITSIETDGLTVDTTFFLVTDETVVLDDDNNVIAFEDLVVGMLVEIRGERDGDGVLRATRIKIEDQDEDEVEVTGAIEQIGTDSLVVAGILFVVDENTQVLDDDNQPISFADLVVGMIVEVEGDVQPDGTVVARKIKIEDQDEDEVEVTGTIEEIGADHLVVAGITFFVDENTIILDDDDQPLTFADLIEGMLVEVQAERQADDSLLATEIEVEDRIEDEVEVTGVIEALSDDTIVVLGRTFQVLSGTVILDDEGNLISPADLAVGQTVEIRGNLLPGGDLVALRIQLEDGAASTLRVVGPIESIGANTLEVIGIHFFTDAATVILDAQGIAISLGDLVVGQTVEVEAVGQPDGTRLATQVEVEDVTIVAAVISEVSEGGITLLDTPFAVAENTLVLGEGNTLLDLSVLAPGQFAAVRSVAGASGPVATKIKLLGSGTLVPTALEDPHVAVPRSFELHQNYPNPFNPSTTITFEILNVQAGDRHVSLSIYNVLGQRVQTLVQGILPAGVHRYEWDARDAGGNPAASGLYLYRLQVGKQVQTRTMMFLK
ncbi:MAG: DUF5666 domain-containing protein, partial [Rhodothermales bacterium]